MTRSGTEPGTQGLEPVIGLEIHVQLRTRTKMFCACPVRFGAPPNSLVCPVCLGLPGALPVPNAHALELACRAAAALGCRVHADSRFDRKHYFYPDLPKGYQITQFSRPLATGGAVVFRTEGETRSVRVGRLHLEEDAGKSIHDRFRGATAIDLNRAGVPLIEIVTEPELRSPSEARAFLVRLKQLLEHYAGVSDCNMEEGSLRVDANFSLRPSGSDVAAAKSEIKNLNSFAFVASALEYECERQTRVRRAGEPLVSETRTWDPVRRETRPLRGKEEEFDYRYFPEPDLPPLLLSPAALERVQKAVTALPHEIEARLARTYGLPEEETARLAATPGRACYFESVVEGRDEAFARVAAHLILRDLAEERKRRRAPLREEDLVAAPSLRRVVELRLAGVLSSDTAARVLPLLVESEDQDVDRLIEKQRLAQVSDPESLGRWVQESVAAHPEEAARYAAGDRQLLDFFMGRVMQASGGRADPGKARELLREKLEG